jgi:hypothetical protein
VTTSEIRLGLPARAEYGRIARVGAAHLAHRRGFTLTEIDDLRLAMDEAAILLLGERKGADGRLDIVYRVTDERVDVEMAGRFDTAAGLHAERIGRFEELVSGLVDAFSIDADAATVSLSKRRGD